MILVTSDWLLNNSPEDQYRFSYLSKEIPRLIKKHRVDHLLILGNLVESKDLYESLFITRVTDLLKEIAEDICITIVQGDIEYQSPTATKLFKWLASRSLTFQYIDQPGFNGLDSITTALLIPYVASKLDVTTQSALLTRCDKAPGRNYAYGGYLERGRYKLLGSPYVTDYGQDPSQCHFILDDGTKTLLDGSPVRKLEFIVDSPEEIVEKNIQPGDIVRVFVCIKGDIGWIDQYQEISRILQLNGAIVSAITPLSMSPKILTPVFSSCKEMFERYCEVHEEELLADGGMSKCPNPDEVLDKIKQDGARFIP